jgi:hypothetical protein
LPLLEPEPSQRLAAKAGRKGRFLATDLKKLLEDITLNSADSYWHARGVVELDISQIYVASYPSLAIRPLESGTDNLRVVRPIPPNYEHPPLDPDDWQFKLDNRFAGRIFDQWQSSLESITPRSVSEYVLCDNCKRLRDFIWQPTAHFSMERSELEDRARYSDCSLCRLIWKAYIRGEESDLTPETLNFRRIDAGLCINDSRLPVLSTFRGPRKSTSHGQDYDAKTES